MHVPRLEESHVAHIGWTPSAILLRDQTSDAASDAAELADVDSGIPSPPVGEGCDVAAESYCSGAGKQLIQNHPSW